ncbi:hypothetical protein [Humitalea rosea]|uniref:hypothetical protein n=1 Tax=Humitalea rosea TaxID=990373 RepID=UPI0011B4ABFE|nr:hypothetical protein [Humitalea rosea]
MRRLFIAAAMLAFPWRSSRGQAPAGSLRPPFNQMRSRDVIDYLPAVEQVLRISVRNNEAEARRLLGTVLEGFSTLEIPDVSLETFVKDYPERATNLIAAQRNATTLLLEVLVEGRTPDGQVAISEGIIDRVIRKICPLYPFC